jgi:hypothetical protein
MAGWLAPLEAALGDAVRPVDFFFRDDDAGWADDRLFALMDRFATVGVPLDVAVIPAELHGDLVTELTARAAVAGLVGYHQHGWCHVNHESEGRKYEFGPSRSPQLQRADLAHGRVVMAEAFGPDCGAVFVPPWNRCTDVTARLLVELGFTVLSRDVTAAPLDVPGLLECPVAVDWWARRRGVRVDSAGRGALLAVAAGQQPAVGVMLHHEVMADGDLAELDELLRLLSDHDSASLHRVRDLVPATHRLAVEGSATP